MLNKIRDFSEKLKNEIPGFLAFSITELKLGKVVYETSNDPTLHIENLSLGCVNFVRSKLTEKVKNIVINLENQIHIIDLIPDSELFIYIVVDSKNVNLAMVMVKLAKCKKLMS